MKSLKLLLDPMRLPFLVLTPACVVLGLGTAVWTDGTVNWFHFLLVLIGAISAHISVNAFNEYFDYKSGLDEKTQRTPFSGGSGRLQQDPLGSAGFIDHLFLYRMDHPFSTLVLDRTRIGFWPLDGNGD